MVTQSVRSLSRLLQHILLFSLLVMLAGCSLFGGDDDEEEVDLPADLVKFESTLRIKKAWSRGIGDGTEFLRLALAPVSDGSRVFAAAHDGRVAAFEAVKGKRLWATKTKLSLSAGPATDGIVVVAGSSDGDVIALNADDGEELWRVTVSGEVLAAPTLTSDLALVRTVDGKLIALRILDGSEAWFVAQSVPRLSVRGTGSAVIRNNLALCGFDNGRLAAYDTNDGSLVWDVLLAPPRGRTEVERLSDLNATIKVVGEDVYAVGYQGGLSALAAESGQILWSRDISSYNGMAADFLNLYVSADESSLFAIARRSGQEMWQIDTLLNRDISGPASVGNSVVVGDFDGYVHYFDATTGAIQARVRAGRDRVAAPPLVVNGMVYVLNENGKLFAFKDATKKK
jgi:outer membrane protein assembly factor BamB